MLKNQLSKNVTWCIDNDNTGISILEGIQMIQIWDIWTVVILKEL